MHLKTATNKKTNRTYLSIVHGYWDIVSKRSRARTIQSIGYLDELNEKYDDPIAHFKKVADKMELERKAEKSTTIKPNMDDQLERGVKHRKNYGHLVLSKVYHELAIDRFLKNARRHEKFKFNTDAVMRLLVFSRILYPGSKRDAVLNQERFFENFKISVDDTYDALTHFDKICKPLQKHLHEKVSQLYGRETDIVYYDVTNYYFEIDKQDELRKRGCEKNKRKDPIVQMGLLIDKVGLPISYKIFPGNTHDSQTLMPVLTDIKKTFNTNRIIVVADKGLNSGDNIAYSTALGDGYIYSKSVRGASEEFKKWILNDNRYRKLSDKYKLKSIIVPDADINVTVAQFGKKKTKKKMKVEQKWVAFYSEKYAIRAKQKRQEVIDKALKMISSPAKYRLSFDYGAASYIKNLKTNKETGEILNTEDILFLDEEKIAEEEKYDGYYAIVTSELDDSDEHIIDLYRGLWRIEESFKITKSVFGSRPVFVRTQEHINGHFLTCFVALLISRIIEMKMNHKYTIEAISDALRKISASHIEQNLWLFNHADHITDDINAIFDTDFGKKYMTFGEIKKNLGEVKKS